MVKAASAQQTYSTMVVAGGWHTLVLDSAGHVHACGAGESGQLGTGLDSDEFRLKPITSLQGVDVVMAACGEAASRPT